MEGPRAAKKEELQAVINLANYVFFTSRGKPALMHERFPHLYNYDNLENLRTIVDKGSPVSFIGVSVKDIFVYGCRLKVGSIGSVCTLPEYRGRGYATRILQHCIKRLDKEKARLMLVSGRRGLYIRAGCRRVGVGWHFNIPRAQAGKLPRGKVRLTGYRRGLETEAARLYAREPVRFHRPLEDCRLLLPTLKWDSKQMFFIRKGSEYLAYVILRITQNKEKKTIGRISESAGSRSALASSLSEIVSRYKLDELNFTVPEYDEDFLFALNNLSIKGEKDFLVGHTTKIINFNRLMAEFLPYMETRIGQKAASAMEFGKADKGFFISLGRKRFVLPDEESLLNFVFGLPRLKAHLPEDKELAQILKQIFPLPLVMPGLNYV
jgi:GNAT superfamily N-acetyltransferase